MKDGEPDRRKAQVRGRELLTAFWGMLVCAPLPALAPKKAKKKHRPRHLLSYIFSHEKIGDEKQICPAADAAVRLTGMSDYQDPLIEKLRAVIAKGNMAADTRAELLALVAELEAAERRELQERDDAPTTTPQ